MTDLSLSDRVEKHVRDFYQLPVEKVAVMLPSFLAVLKNHLNDLEKVLEGGDPIGIGRVGHTLKGALLNLGLAEIAEIAASIEREGESGRTDFDFTEAVSRLKVELKEIL